PGTTYPAETGDGTPPGPRNPARRLRMHRLFIALFTLTLTTPSIAETIRIPVGHQGQTETPMPSRGQSKASVLERFGLADQEHPAVGKPPISRWDYRTFSVYFQDKHVINSDRHHQRSRPTQQEVQLRHRSTTIAAPKVKHRKIPSSDSNDAWNTACGAANWICTCRATGS